MEWIAKSRKSQTHSPSAQRNVQSARHSLKTPWVRAAITLMLCALGGCTYVNVPLNRASTPLEQRLKNCTRAETFATAPAPGTMANANAAISDREFKPTSNPSHLPLPAIHDQDGYFVGLAISGGGSRSANFAAACMFQLERIGLLQRVDYISSVSGGSLTAAYYCLNHEGWNPRDVQNKLTHSFASDIWFQGFLPWNMFALMFTDYDRSDLLAQTLRDNLFTNHGKQQTFADLLPDRPRLLINATDMQSSRRFVFCNQTFDEINTDLAKYPIAYAVAASSSVPIVLHQVTLRDFSTTFEQYRHLVDGGVTDNLGIETLVETYRSQVESAEANALPDPYPHGALFIVLDARTAYDPKVSSQGDPGFFASLKAAAGLTTAAIIGRASSATLDDVVLRNAPDTATAKQIRDGISHLDHDGYVEFKNIGGHQVRVAHFALEQLDNLTTLPFSGFRESVNSINTYFNIETLEAYELYQAAELLMKERFEPKLRAIVNEMGASTTN